MWKKWFQYFSIGWEGRVEEKGEGYCSLSVCGET